MLESSHVPPARRRRWLAAPLAVALTTVFAACGGSSGIASKSASEILSASRAAASGASSVHLTTKTGQVLLDVNLAKTGGAGRLTLSGKTLELMRIGNTLYVKGTASVYKTLGITASVPANTWLKVPSNQSAQLAGFTELSGQVNRLLLLEPPITKGPVSTVNGQKVVELKQTKKVFTRSLYIATSGKPYPVELLLRGQVTGQTTFSDWNKPVTLTPPASSIDLTKLQHR